MGGVEDDIIESNRILRGDFQAQGVRGGALRAIDPTRCTNYCSCIPRCELPDRLDRWRRSMGYIHPDNPAGLQEHHSVMATGDAGFQLDQTLQVRVIACA